MADFTPLSPTCGHCAERDGTCFPNPCRQFVKRQARPAPATPDLMERQALDAAARTARRVMADLAVWVGALEASERRAA